MPKRRWVARSRTADVGGSVTSLMARPQMLVLVESFKIMKKDELLSRKEPMLVRMSGQLTDAEIGGVI